VNSGLRDLPLTETVNEAVMSGDGKFVFAVVDSSRIVRIDVDTARRSEIVPTTPYARALPLDPRDGTVAGGSLVRISNAALMDPGEQPQPLLFGSGNSSAFRQFRLAGCHVGLERDFAPGSVGSIGGCGSRLLAHLRLKTVSDANPFEPAWVVPFPLKVSALHPRWFTELLPAPGNWLVVAHDDFRSVVSPTAPARGGEVIHAYGIGFGEVAPLVPTSQPARAEPLSRITGTFSVFGQAARVDRRSSCCSPASLRA
jgi:hypothetical protein